MGEAREVMDRFTAAAFETKDFTAAAECYADGAVVVTPDQGELTGREAIVAYLRDLADPFPDVRLEYQARVGKRGNRRVVHHGYPFRTVADANR
jgi:ketosteroid isomerase-like protein